MWQGLIRQGPSGPSSAGGFSISIKGLGQGSDRVGAGTLALCNKAEMHKAAAGLAPHRLGPREPCNASASGVVLLEARNVEAVARLVHQAPIVLCQRDDLAAVCQDGLRAKGRQGEQTALFGGERFKDTHKRCGACRICPGVVHNGQRKDRRLGWCTGARKETSRIRVGPLVLCRMHTSMLWRPTLPKPWTMTVLSFTPRGMLSFLIHS